MNIELVASPNYRKGRSGYKPEIVVLHIMAGSLSGTDAWFKNSGSQVSSHYGIGENGEIHQYVDESDTAWANGRVSGATSKIVNKHAGINPNLFSISIEHEGSDLSKQPFSEIKASAELVADICKRNNIPMDRDHIIGHYEIFAGKPNCPATDKGVIQKIIDMAKDQSTVESDSAVLLPELRDALIFAHDIKIGDNIDPKDQLVMAERLVELKKSEIAALDTIQKIKKLI